MHVVAVGGSDAGITAALRAREAGPAAEVTVVAADAHPNFSICTDLDLACTPPLGSPWDAVQAGAQAWVREAG